MRGGVAAQVPSRAGTISPDGRMVRVNLRPYFAAGGRVLPLRRGALHAYFERMRARGYPAVEHSGAYRGAYDPSYRVVLRAFLPETGGAAVR